VTGAEIDFAGVFQALPGMVALLTPEMVFLDANEDYLSNSGRSREQLVGRYLFDVFPDRPGDPASTGMRNLEASLRRVVESGERDSMALQRYDVESLDRPGVWEERYWSPVNVPVLDENGAVALVVHRVEEVTEFVRARGGLARDDGTPLLEAELYTRARELQELNERLRRAHAREREVAVVLQDALLPSPEQVRTHHAAVRYRPATSSLNVCGDWYDLVALSGDDPPIVVIGELKLTFNLELILQAVDRAGAADHPAQRAIDRRDQRRILWRPRRMHDEEIRELVVEARGPRRDAAHEETGNDVADRRRGVGAFRSEPADGPVHRAEHRASRDRHRGPRAARGRRAAHQHQDRAF